jgi:hypothetical protein
VPCNDLGGHAAPIVVSQEIGLGPLRINASQPTMIAYGSRIQEEDPKVQAIARYWVGHAEDLVTNMKGTLNPVFEFADHPFAKETARAIDTLLTDDPVANTAL